MSIIIPLLVILAGSIFYYHRWMRPRIRLRDMERLGADFVALALLPEDDKERFMETLWSQIRYKHHERFDLFFYNLRRLLTTYLDTPFAQRYALKNAMVEFIEAINNYFVSDEKDTRISALDRLALSQNTFLTKLQDAAVLSKNLDRDGEMIEKIINLYEEWRSYNDLFRKYFPGK